jgi:pimeloyl-ACP methyl ester carboxylesterase/streptogramin lyase
MMVDARIGSVIAGYRIESLLGRGGMGVVYLAEHSRLQRKAALKVLPADVAADENFRRRFIRESQIAASIDHPNIIQIYDAGEADGVLYIAMRHVDGLDLSATIKSEGALGFGRTILILTQVADALDAAHAEGLVHRDVKPANILMASGPEGDHVFLSDFGLTKRGAAESHLTSSGEVLGTIDYMAPEQIEGKPVDGRADLYSLGCVAYECLSGHKPYERDTDVAVLWAHMMAPLPVLGDLRDVPPSVEDVLGRALAKSPEERFATCREFVTALAAELPEGAGAVPKPVRARRRRRGVQRIIGTWPGRVVAALLAVALAIGGYLAIRPSAKPIDLTALANVVAGLDPASGSVRTAFRAGGLPSAVAFSNGELWVANRASGTIQKLDPNTGRAQTVGTITNPTAMSVGGGLAWVLGGFPGSSISSFKLTTGEKGTTIDLGTSSEDIAVGGESVWATDLDHRALLRIDPASQQVKSIDVGGVPTGVAFGRGSVWVTVDGGGKDEVLRIDPKSEGVKRIQLKARPNSVAVGDEGVWVTEGDDHAIVAIDPAKNLAGRTVRVGFDPVRMAMGGGAVWTADHEGRTVSRVDVRTGKVRTTALGLFPTGIAVGSGRVWVTANPDTVKLQSAICPDEVPVNDPTTCWTLTVPERHTDPGGRSIQLWVERIKTPQGITPAPDPVVVVGQNLAEHVTYAGTSQPLPARTHREAISLDLRGTGLSTPKLTCPEVEGLPSTSYALRLRDGRKEFLDAVKACHDRLVAQGVDLGSYNITEAAEDVEDLRRAIGVGQWNLRGLSYSSRVAFEVMRDFPAGVRAAWMDSPEYPQADYFAQVALGAPEGLDSLQKLCAADTACKAHFPDLPGTFDKAVASLNAHPVTVTVKDAALTKNKPVPVVIDGDLLARFVRHDIASTPNVPLMPARIYAAAAGRFGNSPDSLAGSYVNALKFCKGFRAPCQLPIDFSGGLALSMICHDEAPFANRSALPTAGIFFEDYGKNPYLDACGIWDVGAASPVTHTAVTTSIPVLIFHGQFDTYAPPSTATKWAKGLQRSFVYAVPGYGINVVGGDNCPIGIRNAWIQNPIVAPEVGCLANMPKTVTGTISVAETSY